MQGDRSGDERSERLYEDSGNGRNREKRLGKYGRRVDSCTKRTGAQIHVSRDFWVLLKIDSPHFFTPLLHTMFYLFKPCYMAGYRLPQLEATVLAGNT